MLDQDPDNWRQVTWAMLLSSAVVAYMTRLLERIHSKRVKSLIIELVEFIVCVGIAFGAYLTSTLFHLDERLVWLLSVYLGHKGTRYVFSRLDLAADTYLTKMTGEKNDKSSGKNNA